MNKQEALQKYFDNSIVRCAREVGCSHASVSGWPDELPPRIRDRVQAVLWRRHERELAAPGQHAPAQSGRDGGP